MSLATPFTAPQFTPITAADTRTVSLRDRRKKPRLAVPPMYSSVVVRALNQKIKAIDGHAVNVSESGIAVELDDLLTPGTPVTVEFKLSGLGRGRAREWPVFAATAEVIRNQDVEEFPGGPYMTALRFIQISSMAQAHIARYIAAHAGPRTTMR